MNPLLVGLDVGSQSAKVAVYDAAGALVAEAAVRLRPPETPRPGVVEHPGEDLWEACAAACRTALAEVDVSRVVGVGLCGVRFCRALMRSDGSLAAPVLSWMDDRVSRPYDGREAPADVAKVTAASGYLTHRLTGAFTDSAAAYRGQWPLEVAAEDWQDDAAVAALGLRRDLLADLVAPGEVLGHVVRAATAATGLPTDLPVIASGNDKAVEALGCGVVERGQVLLSLGTYIAAMTPVARDLPAAPTHWDNAASTPGAVLAESGGIRRGMWTVTWLRDLVGPSLGAGEATHEALEEAAGRVAPGADGLLAVLDWLAPTDEPWRAGAFVGFDVRHGAGHLHRALLEGIALTMRSHLVPMARHLDLTELGLRVSGGGARSAVMLQVLADVLRTPVRRTLHAGSAASLGAAICASVGTGVHSGFSDAVAAMVHEDLVVEPDDDRAAVYDRVATLHAELTAALRPVLQRRADLLRG